MTDRRQEDTNRYRRRPRSGMKAERRTTSFSSTGTAHIWKPLLHEVATGSLDANLDEVIYPSHGHRWSYRFFYGALESIDREARTIDGKAIQYRYALPALLSRWAGN
jgi:hypothetical protein